MTTDYRNSILNADCLQFLPTLPSEKRQFHPDGPAIHHPVQVARRSQRPQRR